MAAHIARCTENVPPHGYNLGVKNEFGPLVLRREAPRIQLTVFIHSSSRAATV